MTIEIDVRVSTVLLAYTTETGVQQKNIGSEKLP